VVLFGSVFLSHSKTVNAQVNSFLNLQYIKKSSNQKALQFLMRDEKPKNMKNKKCFDIQARGPGHLPGLPNS